MIGAVTVLVYLLPSQQAGLIYSASAIAQGEWWRLLTGHLVHLSSSHLAYNLAAILVAGSLLEARRHPHVVLLCLFSALMISVVLYLMQPALAYYGGLSGVVIALVVYLCLHGAGERTGWGWICRSILAVVVLKTIYELVFSESPLQLVTDQPFVVVPLSHAMGLVSALLLYLAADLWGRRKTPQGGRDARSLG